MSKKKNKIDKRLRALERLIGRIADNMNRAHFNDYVAFMADTKRFLLRSLLMGAAKGFGAAIGFSVLGAIMIYILQGLAKSSLPYIADFISDIINIIEHK